MPLSAGWISFRARRHPLGSFCDAALLEKDCRTVLDTSLVLNRPKRTGPLATYQCYLRDGSQEILQLGSSETGVGEHAHDFCCRVFEYEIKSFWVMGFTLSGEKVEKSA